MECIGILNFIRGVGLCMFFMSIGLAFRGDDIGVVIVSGSVGLANRVCMNLAIKKIRKTAEQHEALLLLARLLVSVPAIPNYNGVKPTRGDGSSHLCMVSMEKTELLRSCAER